MKKDLSTLISELVTYALKAKLTSSVAFRATLVSPAGSVTPRVSQSAGLSFYALASLKVAMRNLKLERRRECI